MYSIESKLEKYEDNKELVLEWAESLQYVVDGFYEDMCILNPLAKFYVMYLRKNNTDEEEFKGGYFVITMDAVVAFFIRRKYQLYVDPKDVFKSQIVDTLNIKSANLVSLDTYFFNLLLDVHKSINVMGYAPFVCERKEVKEYTHPLDFKDPILAALSDEERLWEAIKEEKFFIKKEELGPMLKKKQLFIFRRKSNVENLTIGGIGVCTTSDIFKNVWSIGMFVAPKFRKMGVGTYILNTMQNMCIQNGKFACAGCDKRNVGSRKTLQKSGMINRGSFLAVELQ